MRAKTIKAVLNKEIGRWLDSIEDEKVKALAGANTIVTGGAIASMLLNEPVNDFDIYFRTKEAAWAVANYYVGKFNDANNAGIKAQEEDDGRIRIVVESGRRGETAGEARTLQDTGEIEDTYNDAEQAALSAVDDDAPKYRPVFLSTNAITLSHKMQIVLRFYGEPNEIHENYDFVHCTNYWSIWDGNLALRPLALEALLAKELVYVGSKYPVCSVMRLRKFIKRGWVINAGQVLKMMMQISELDLTNPAVLEDQLTGVDSAYFIQIIDDVKAKDPAKVNAAYLVEIIDRMF
ncbi:hypothetical protein SAMN05216428_102321 [Nitrosospira sp. Nsp11]|uniref:hypothetical protein n=1 Tax=Nitrosospira sp. Nsp11 TaxID=1855338 RepID=UPI000923B152|nr:hypothetical protein [Nitrosospira sp. Nsp11]SHL41239.1 hypothetical protein SAMN05216428_102321 [Nitrosospira sp. Nsp11]